jgi:hypothetical protein
MGRPLSAGFLGVFDAFGAGGVLAVAVELGDGCSPGVAFSGFPASSAPHAVTAAASNPATRTARHFTPRA